MKLWPSLLLLVRPIEILADHGEEFPVVGSEELPEDANHLVRHLSKVPIMSNVVLSARYNMAAYVFYA